LLHFAATNFYIRIDAKPYPYQGIFKAMEDYIPACVFGTFAKPFRLTLCVVTLHDAPCFGYQRNFSLGAMSCRGHIYLKNVSDMDIKLVSSVWQFSALLIIWTQPLDNLML